MEGSILLRGIFHNFHPEHPEIYYKHCGTPRTSSLHYRNAQPNCCISRSPLERLLSRDRSLPTKVPVKLLFGTGENNQQPQRKHECSFTALMPEFPAGICWHFVE